MKILMNFNENFPQYIIRNIISACLPDKNLGQGEEFEPNFIEMMVFLSV
jgi:hypothetical protein